MLRTRTLGWGATGGILCGFTHRVLQWIKLSFFVGNCVTGCWSDPGWKGPQDPLAQSLGSTQGFVLLGY